MANSSYLAVPGVHRAKRMPSLYVLNAAALSKPHAIEHLASDLISYNIDVAVITETHFKQKHTDNAVSIDNYVLYRSDRTGRRGGGVALYVRSTLKSAVWMQPQPSEKFELMWVCVDETFIAALYHPPQPIYRTESLLNHIELCIENLHQHFQSAEVIVAGDLNQLSDQDIIERTGLIQIVRQPTRGVNLLDRIYVSKPVYSKVHVVSSVVKSDHKAIVAYTDEQPKLPKVASQKIFRRKSPSQHALFLQYAAKEDFLSAQPCSDTQTQFDEFYSKAMSILNRFYPERAVTITTRDPEYVTPDLKLKLRRKNRLMRAGRTDEAGALAQQIGKDITRRECTRLRRVGNKADKGDIWAAVRRLTSRHQHTPEIPGVDSDALNNYYAAISTDQDYRSPSLKESVRENQQEYISEWEIFKILDHLRPTATGLDQLPSWFLRIGAPIFSKPLARLFNLSLATSTVPQQWKNAVIKPIPKTSNPQQPSDFRPISITPVLTRIMERTIVRQFLYPAFLSASYTDSLLDQFGFRPTGSTTGALITILHTVTNLLATNPYVCIIALDFSKAFDTVRHSTLLEKMAKLELPDNVYNWLVDFFYGHAHCTQYNGKVSALHEITASLIQGSSLGPSSYVVNAADLKAVTNGNEMTKFADDTYIIIPASNIDTRDMEIDNVETWSRVNNLKLNRSKCCEMIITDNRGRAQNKAIPIVLEGLHRVTSLKILGVTITNNLSMSEHVRNVIANCAQTLYALRVLRTHGMTNSELQIVYRSVVVAKIIYAASAWWAFTSAADRQRIDAFIRRSIRCGFCAINQSTFEELCVDADGRLFRTILSNSDHLLARFLPNKSVAFQNYNLRWRPHNLILPPRLTHLTDCNYINRMLYFNSY